MKDFVSKVFSKKRTNSEYLKYEDGEIVAIEKVAGPDNTPRLDLSNNSSTPNTTQTSTLNTTKSYEPNNKLINKEEHKDKTSINFLVKIGGVILLITLLGFAINIAFSFIDKTQKYIDPNTSKVETQQTNVGKGTNNLNDTQNNIQDVKTPNDSPKTGIINGSHESTVTQATNYEEIETLLKIVRDTHKSILTIISEEKSDIIMYLDSKTNPYVIKSKLNRQIIIIQNTYKNIQTNKTLFEKFNAQTLYLVELQRLDNALNLLNELNSVEEKSAMVKLLNEHITTDNSLIDKQLQQFRYILDKNYIKYTIENGQLKWTIPIK